MDIDRYFTLKEEQTGLFRDRGSKFIAYAIPVNSIENFESVLIPIKKEHPKARHFCYAYIMGPNEEVFRHNDDGEPGGSAGLPIYNQLLSRKLNYVGVVVVRYFGGKKLGVPGLINAYKTATQEALDADEIIECFITDNIKINYQFDQTGAIMRALNEFELSIDENSFEGSSPIIKLTIRKSLTNKLKTKLLSLLLKRDESDISGDEEIDGFSIINI